jgi:hypothetical protein
MLLQPGRVVMVRDWSATPETLERRLKLACIATKTGFGRLAYRGERLAVLVFVLAQNLLDDQLQDRGAKTGFIQLRYV